MPENSECGGGSYLDAIEAIGLESPDLGGDFLNNLSLVQWLHCHYFIFNTLTTEFSSFISLAQNQDQNQTHLQSGKS